jgi:hypothetical protein
MMKRFSLYIIIGVALLLSGCNKDNPDNGHLEGFWQMTSAMNMLSSSMAGSDMRDSGITWSFQGYILELRDVKKVNQDIVASFEHNGDELKLSKFYFVDRDEGDRLIEDTEENVATYLMPYGINSASEQLYYIEELSSNKMVLLSKDRYAIRLEFRKY